MLQPLWKLAGETLSLMVQWHALRWNLTLLMQGFICLPTQTNLMWYEYTINYHIYILLNF